MHSQAHLERQHRIVLELLQEPGNRQCADCFAQSPRWASYTLGIFLCMSCATVHRRLGPHISQVKSVTLDPWSRDQVAHMRAVGNTRSNQFYLPDPRRHPPPTDVEPGERGELDLYIRRKYERREFVRPTPRVMDNAGTRLQGPPARNPSSLEKPPRPSPGLETKTHAEERAKPPAAPSPSFSAPSQSLPTPATSVPASGKNGPDAKLPQGAAAPQGVFADLLDLQDGPTAPVMAFPQGMSYAPYGMAYAGPMTPMTTPPLQYPASMQNYPYPYVPQPMPMQMMPMAYPPNAWSYNTP